MAAGRRTPGGGWAVGSKGRGTRRRRIAALALLTAGLAVSITWSGGPAGAAADCSSYAVYSAVGSAAGLRTLQSAPGASLVSQADGNLPAAQAQADSVLGSVGWAGAPYSAAVADNAGVTGANANDIPVFATSSHPTQPESSKSTPAATIEAKSAARSSTAKAVAGADSEALSAGKVATSAAAACDEAATVRAVADSATSAIDVAGVLRIAAVRSHAMARVDATGRRTVEATLEVDGATVAGQPVGITDRGVVAGSSVAPLPANPVTAALAEAGITVRYLAADKDAAKGEAMAPGLEITVAREIPGVGTGPATTTYVVGQAYARATTSGDGGATAAVPDLPFVTPAFADPVTPGTEPLPTPSLGGSDTAGSLPGAAGGNQVALQAGRIATDWSVAPAYNAMGAGALLLLAAWFGFEKMAARFPWR
jgi:hypothetical protein